MKLPIGRKHIPLIATAAVLLAIYLTGCIAYDNFSGLRVIRSLFRDWSALGIIAIGMTFVILSGGIDLSVGSVLAFTTIFTARLIELHGWHPAEAWLAGLAVGTVFGGLMGGLIQSYKLPPFLVTLGGMFFMRGMAFVVYKQPIGLKSDAFFSVADFAFPSGGGLNMPVTVIVLLGVFFVAMYLAHGTKWGRNVYAIGGDEQSAVLMGLPVGRTKVLIYALNGFLSALAGIVYTLYLPSGDPGAGWGFELDAIAAVVIGGTLLTGGVGYVGGTLMGVLIVGVLDQILKFNGNLGAAWLRIAMGGLLLTFILLQRVIARLSAHRTVKE